MLREILLTTVGVALIVVTLRDVVHELFHPESSGSMSRTVAHAVWRATRAVGQHHRAAIYHAGPLILIAVALVWSALLALGWALIYLPRLPAAFTPNPALPASATRGLLVALYVSMSSLTTLSPSDIMPKGELVRWAVALESFVGPLLVTAWITWVLSIYPVIAERRAFVHEVLLLRKATSSPENAATDYPPTLVGDLLQALTSQVLRVNAQLRQTRVSYYFQNDAPELAVALQIPWALAFARAGQRRAEEPAVQHQAKRLELAIRDLLGDIGEAHLGLHDAPPQKVIEALAEDHLLTEELAKAR